MFGLALLAGVVTNFHAFAVIPVVLVALACITTPGAYPRLEQVVLSVACVWICVIFTPERSAAGLLGRQAAFEFTYPAMFGVLLIQGTRLFMANPIGGLPLSLALGLGELLACGSVRSGPIFPLVAVGYLFLSAQALHAADPERPDWSRVGAAPRRALRRLLGSALGLGVVLALSIPPLWGSTLRWAIHRTAADRLHAGFEEGPIELDSLEGMFESEAVVLRVYGERVDHLRGGVYSHYHAGHWLPLDRGVRAEMSSHATMAASVEIRAARRDLRQFFLPLEAARVEPRPGSVRVDGAGVLRASQGTSVESVRFVPVHRERFTPLAPLPEDRLVPAEMAEWLQPLADRWTHGALTPSQRMEALLRRLESDFTYSLDAPSPAQGDPLRAFLTRTRQGHCAYFASALALLGRAAGVPTRVVAGFRVQEYNPLGRYFIVRDRDAHAWVEAYLPDRGWSTFDPSPMARFARGYRSETPWPQAMFDVMRSGVERLDPLFVFGMLACVLLASEIRRRLRRPTPRGKHARDQAVEAFPRFIDRLCERILRMGLQRLPGETLEHLARRLRGTPDTKAPVLAALLVEYAAWRYGRVGDEERLERKLVQECVQGPRAPLDL